MSRSSPEKRITSEIMNNFSIPSIQFISGIQNSTEYQEDDSAAIYKNILKNLKPIDFSNYLRMYVHKAAEYKADFVNVPVENYIETVTHAFSSKGVPASIKPTSTRLRAAVKNWFSQKTASRETVILLGFGLGMSFEDVDGFLTDALQEGSLNPKNPVETICWYCLKNHLGYHHFRQLLSKYELLPGTLDDTREISRTGTMKLRTEMEDIRDEKALLRYLDQLKRIDGKSRQSVDARMLFDQLYDQARDIIKDLNQQIEDENKKIELARLKERLSRSDRFDDEQKQEQIRNCSERRKIWKKEEITPIDFENVLLSSIPRDRNGNLIPMKGSTLNEQFRGKRLNRQHIQEILDGTGTISRYDLTTMSFFVLSREYADESNYTNRSYDFINHTNKILDRCGMGEMYMSNPYEAFLTGCMLTDYPLGTYADIWEMSYEDTETEG